ncbi:hypothetical protein [Spiroplasma endosymbiont of Apeira syringaria]|uniref:hypothetical protein n=1 Tax=Spiroplasma endosymbiont of Apeira syringaria TaxID=3066307 RepID=UPI0030CCCEC8
MQDIAVQFEKHCWIHSVSLFPPQVHVGRSPLINYETIEKIKKQLLNLKAEKIKLIEKSEKIEKKINNYQKTIQFWIKQDFSPFMYYFNFIT